MSGEWPRGRAGPVPGRDAESAWLAPAMRRRVPGTNGAGGARDGAGGDLESMMDAGNNMVSRGRRKCRKGKCVPQEYVEKVNLGGFMITDEIRKADVVVIGGGLAGLCAALACAREGVETILVNDRPVLGGNASTEIRIPCSGAAENNPWAMETGIILELLTEERAGSFEKPGEGMVNARWDTVLYDVTRRQKNLTVLANTSVLQVEMVGKNRIAAVFGLNRRNEKRFRLEADVFIEATGDGLVGALAGVPFRVGAEARSEYGEPLAPEKPGDWTLGCSLYFHARDVGRPISFQPPAWAARYETEESLGDRHHGNIDGGYWWVEIGYPYDTIKQDDEIRDELLRHLFGVWDHIKNHCTNREKARSYALDWVSMLPGRRESRRFVGTHVLKEMEIRSRALFPDRVAYGGWLIDDHTKGGILKIASKPSFDDVTQGACYVAPYSVPLSSLHAPQVENLLFAGRVMSASRVVFNSLRVMRTLAVVGQAAGVAAARAVRHGRMPGCFIDEDVFAVQQAILRQDGYIPFVSNDDPGDLARTAQVTASSQAVLEGESEGPGLELREACAQVVPLSGDRLEALEVFLENRGDKSAVVTAGLFPARDIWDLDSLPRPDIQSVPLAAAQVSVAASLVGRAAAGKAASQGWVRFPFGARVDPRRVYWVCLTPAPGVYWHVNHRPYPGFSVARKAEGKWQFAHVRGWRNLAVRVEPVSDCFGPESVRQGAARPESWPNIWISDPAQSLPQWIELQWAAPQRFNKVHLTFDTDLSRTYWGMSGGFRAPECAKDFSIAVPDGQNKSLWRTVAQVRGNYQRLCLVELAPCKTDRLRIVVEATHGNPSARIYEIRAYDEAG